MNIIVDTMTCTCIVMHFSICQLLSFNLFTQHVSYLLWRDTTSELWTLVHSFTSHNTILLQTLLFYISLQTNIIFHTICLILCFQQAGEIDKHTITLGQSILAVLCAGSKWTTPLLAPLTLSEVSSSPTGSIILVSYWRKTCCYTHHTFLLGSPRE